MQPKQSIERGKKDGYMSLTMQFYLKMGKGWSERCAGIPGEGGV